MSGLSSNRRLASRGGGVLEVARSLRILWPIRRDDDVIETECQHHLARNLVLLFVAGLRPVTVRPQALVQIAAVQIDQMIALFHDLFGDQKRSAIGLRPI